MLTDKEKRLLIEQYSFGRDINAFALVGEVERAVLAKAMKIPKQEPIGKICKSAECGGVDFYFDKIPDGETMLYAEPQPAQAAAIPEND